MSKTKVLISSKPGDITLRKLLSDRLREWKVSEDQQAFTHRPKVFGDVFPTDASKEALIRKLWWWRYANLAEAKRIFPPWGKNDRQWTWIMLNVFTNSMELSAWFYEFRARYEGRYQWDFHRPWIRCSDQQRSVLELLVPSDRPSKFYLPVSRPTDCWVEMPGKVNLLLNDKTLADGFLARVREERERRGLSAPKYRGGVRRRKISWVPIESMDLEHYKICKLNGAERGHLSKARKKYEGICKSLNMDP